MQLSARGGTARTRKRAAFAALADLIQTLRHSARRPRNRQSRVD